MKIIKESWKIILIAITITTSVLVFGFDEVFAETPQTLYHVYLDGKTIGTIESKEALEKYIDKKQNDIKSKYGVNKVYSPKGITIEKEVSYNAKILTSKEAYDKISKQSSFTIDGYEIIINQEEKVINNGEEARVASSTILFMTDETFLNESINTIAKIFAGEEAFINFEDDIQKEIEDTGEYLNNIYIEEKITIEKTNIPTDELIFTASDDLTKYLLYGTLEKQDTYKVKEGDTIEEVAFDNNLAADEFLVANPIFTNVDNILFPGQEVAIGLIKPKISIVVELTNIEKQEVKYEKIIKYDSSIAYGTNYTKQTGQNGLNKVTQEIKYINGKIETAVITNTEELVPKINKITIRGGKSLPNDGGGTWYWPTIRPYIITSPYGPRWGTFHHGTDISGCGHGSPIFAAASGIVVQAEYNSTSGYFVKIDHGNGYASRYVHLSKYYVHKGQAVQRGEVIGAMGSTGYSTGTHLHFEIRYNNVTFNPLGFY